MNALAKLKRLGLTLDAPSDRYIAIQLPEALVRLDHAWDSFFEFPSQGNTVAVAA